jgi:arylsulfatase A-like enzyme
MPADNILVLVVDGLRASALGAYGNTTFSTPALDQLAAESFLLDCCFADSAELSSVYRALWRSLHPLRPDAIDRDAPSLPRLLAKGGYQTTLITDNTDIVGDTAAGDFDECIQLDGAIAHQVEDASDTCLARICAAASEAIQLLGAKPAPQLVWVHSRGMYGPWDAPLELQRSLLDQEEGDPAPFDGIRPPNLALDEVHDPDLAYAVNCAYAAQIMVLDACVDGLVERVMEVKGAGAWLVVLIGCRGFGLGEHGWIGAGGGRLSAELLHVPMLWRFPDGMGALARSRCLSSHLDLGPTLLDWVGAASAPPAVLCDGLSLLPLARDARVEWRDALLAANSAGERVVRTADWCLRRGTPPITFDVTSPSVTSSDSNDVAVELFVRPDDQLEANNVAGLCQDEVAQLSQSLDSLAERYLSREPSGQAKSSDTAANDPK